MNTHPTVIENFYVAKELFNAASTGLCGLFFVRWLATAAVTTRRPTSSSLLSALMMVMIPFVYFYAVANRPTRDSFDVKQQIKRVLRGYHLPADHPRRAQGFWHALAVRAAASVTTETMDWMVGTHRPCFWSLGGAAWLVTVQLPANDNETLVWIGIHGKWYYITNSRRVQDWIDQTGLFG